MLTTNLVIGEPADVYHARAGEYLTSHLLADFRHCPQLYHRKRLGELQDVDCPAYLVGRAAHTVILEGMDAFQRSFAVGGLVEPQGPTGRPDGDLTENAKDVLTCEQYDVVMQMASSVQQHALAQELLAGGIAECVVRTEYCGVPCQIRIDSFDSHQGLVDLKTCDDLSRFEADARRFEYVYQVGFYRGVLSKVIGLTMPVFFVAVERRQPHRCGVWRVAAEALARAERENVAAIARLRSCLNTSEWATGFEEMRVFDLV